MTDRPTAEAGSRSTGQRLRYHPELDGVRAIAVLAVMVFHVSSYGKGFHLWGGFLGVDVFFVLSGYLITTLLLREWDKIRTIRFRLFYARRALRLLPALALLLVFGYIVTRSLQHPLTSQPYVHSVAFVVLYIGNWAGVRNSLGVLDHTWTLAIEEQYYLLWPLTLLALLRYVRTKRKLALFLCFGAIAIAGLRFGVYASGRHLLAALSTATRTDGIVLGSALALALADPPAWLLRFLRRSDVLLIASGALIAASFRTYWESAWLYEGGLFVFNLCAVFVVGHLVVRPDGLSTKLLSTQPLPIIGRISYGLYLFSSPMNRLVFGYPAQRSGAAPVALSLAGSFVLAGLSFWLLESRVLRLKSRFGSLSEMPRVVEATT